MTTPTRPAVITKSTVDFDFPNFSKLPAGVGQCTNGPAVELLGTKWRLGLYPGGDSEECAGSVSSLPQHQPQDETLANSHRIFVMNAKTKKPHKCLCRDAYTYPIARSELLERASELLVNDTLVLRLELSSTQCGPRPVEPLEYNFQALQGDEQTTDLEIHVVSSDNEERRTINDGDDHDKDQGEETEGDEKDNSSCTVLKAHKLVLSAFSEAFKTMFYGPVPMEEAHTNKFTIEDFSVKAVQSMLDFCYCGDIVFEDCSEALELLALSSKYEMNTLTSKCVDRLMDLLSEENAVEILHAVHILSLTEVKAAVMDFIVDHPNSIIKGAVDLETCDKGLLIEVMMVKAQKETREENEE